MLSKPAEKFVNVHPVFPQVTKETTTGLISVLHPVIQTRIKKEYQMEDCSACEPWQSWKGPAAQQQTKFRQFYPQHCTWASEKLRARISGNEKWQPD